MVEIVILVGRLATRLWAGLVAQPTRHCWAEDRNGLLIFGDDCFALAVPHIMPLLFLMLQKPSHLERLEADE